MRVAVVTGSRCEQAMGLESAELRLLEALRARTSPDELCLRVVGGLGARRYAQRLGARWYPARPDRASRRAWQRADLIHLTGLTVPPPRRRPFVAMVHDLSPLHFPDEGRLPPWTAEIVAEARRLLTPSSFIAAELERELGVEPERIVVIGSGPGSGPGRELLSEKQLAALGLAKPFVLRLGGYTQRKNVRLLLDAWPSIRRQTGALLALVGPAQSARDRLLAAAPSLDGVVVLDYLPVDVLGGLLRSAAVLVSTSLYEGFGLPPLEAMAAGTPVLAVRTPFVEEVCNGGAVLVENHPAGLADALAGLLNDGDKCEQLRDAGRRRATAFTWERSAERVRAAYDEVRAKG